jgi:oligosaccharide 4-alpha-D-glucosyltransferase
MHTGDAWVKEPVTLEDMPVYVREGTILPLFMKDSIHNTAEYNGKMITIRYYPSENKTSYTLYDDDGHTNKAFEKGNYQLINFTAQTDGKEVKITVSSKKKDTRKLMFSLPEGYQLQAATQGGKPLNITAGKMLELDYKGTPVEVTLTLK